MKTVICSTVKGLVFYYQCDKITWTWYEKMQILENFPDIQEEQYCLILIVHVHPAWILKRNKGLEKRDKWKSNEDGTNIRTLSTHHGWIQPTSDKMGEGLADDICVMYTIEIWQTVILSQHFCPFSLVSDFCELWTWAF